MATGFLDYLFDSEYRQRRDINDTAVAAADARFYGDLALENVEQLRKQVLAQRDQLRDLSITVSVLVKMLGDVGPIDDKVLRYRVEAEIEALTEAAKPTIRLETCSRCHTKVTASQTSMTEDGPVCDRCMAGVAT
jgi:formylmethanofuran dehydrogenase subunit E